MEGGFSQIRSHIESFLVVLVESERVTSSPLYTETLKLRLSNLRMLDVTVLMIAPTGVATFII